MPIFKDAYFVWVPILLILRYTACNKYLELSRATRIYGGKHVSEYDQIRNCKQLTLGLAEASMALLFNFHLPLPQF